jgi:hypothetical protein
MPVKFCLSLVCGEDALLPLFMYIEVTLTTTSYLTCPSCLNASGVRVAKKGSKIGRRYSGNFSLPLRRLFRHQKRSGCDGSYQIGENADGENILRRQNVCAIVEKKLHTQIIVQILPKLSDLLAPKKRSIEGKSLDEIIDCFAESHLEVPHQPFRSHVDLFAAHHSLGTGPTRGVQAVLVKLYYLQI